MAGTALAVLGGLVVWLVRNFEWVSETPEPPTTIDVADMEPLIRHAAEQWAAAHGRPEAAGLVADKLRALYVITYCVPASPQESRRRGR